MRRGSLETAVGALVIVIAVIFAIFAYEVTDYGKKMDICSLLNLIT